MVQQSTERDPVLQSLQHYVYNGWPQKRTNGEMKQYSQRRGCLTAVNSCILFGERVIVPSGLRTRVLRQFHRGYPGIIRMKAFASNLFRHRETSQWLLCLCTGCEIPLES
ncbi:uncharacterized protein DEA37_0001274 [Paragonimus westermani]|uniref:Uncharacterized protein n=1 Tax=Paragonimus westermani TaxID=34504 RepID=A0A5J4NR58_9TREM|nr:uncharacterized protein DEA37_0001274 [Paragonimus westermani]